MTQSDDSKAIAEFAWKNAEILDDYGSSSVSYLEKGFIGGMTHEREKHRWISVDAALPEDECRYLTLQEGGCVAILFYQSDGTWMDLLELRTRQVTHWMPLPEPPKDKK